MKLENENHKSLDVAQLLEQCYEEEQQFWQDIEKHVIYGVPAADEKGHWVEIRFRVRPSQIDLITAIREKHPLGMYKSQADLLRSLIATGCKTHFEFFKRKKSLQWQELEEILHWLNIIGRHHRLKELGEDAWKAKKLIMEGPGKMEEKIPIVEFLGKMQRKLNDLQLNSRCVE